MTQTIVLNTDRKANGWFTLHISHLESPLEITHSVAMILAVCPLLLAFCEAMLGRRSDLA